MRGGRERAVQAEAGRRGGARRALLAATLALLAALLVLAAALAWLGSAQGLSWLLQRPWVAAHTGLQVRGVRGSLWSGLRLRSLDWSDGSTRVSATQLALRWQPARLLAASPRLQVLELDVGQLDVVRGTRPAAAGAAAPAPPADLRPPIAVRIQSLRVHRLRVRQAPALAWRDLGSLRGSLRGDAQRWQASLQAAGAWGSLQARAGIDARAPFALQGELGGDAAVRQRTVPWQASLGGRLARVDLQARAHVAQARARVRAELRPFDAIWLGPASLEVDDVDPRRLDAAWPQALLSLRADLRQDAGAAWQARVELRNAQAGPIDRERLPLLDAQADVQLRDDVLRVDVRRADLAGAALVDGSVRWPLRGQARTLSRLRVRGLDLHALMTRLKPTHLDGELSLQATTEAQQLQATLAQAGWNIELQARRAGTRIDVQRARLRAHGASLRFTGSLDTAAAQAFRVDAVLHDFQPRRFGDWPDAHLNAHLQAHGTLQPRRAEFALQLQPSRWRSRVLQGHASGVVSPGSLQELQADLRLGDNTLRARGSFGRASDRLRLDLRAPVLAQLGEGWAGSARAAGVLRGSPADPAVQLAVHLRGLRGPQALRVGSLDADVSLLHGLRGSLALQAQAADVHAGGLTLQQAALHVDGTLRRHTLRLRLRDGKRLQLSASAQGSWLAGRGWSGSIDSLDNAGSYPVRLAGSARLRIGSDGSVHLGDALLRSPGGTIELQALARSAGVWSSEGSARDVDPAYWARLAGVDLHGVHSDLRLQAQWQWGAGNEPLAHVRILRTSGDLQLPGEPGLALGLSQLRLRIDTSGRRVHAVLDAAGTHLGELHADAGVDLSHGPQGWGIAGDAPLRGAARLSLPDVSWVSVLLPQAARVGGRLQGELQVGGVAAAPRLSGSLQGRALSVVLPTLGLDLRDGTLDASLAGERVELRALSLRDRSGGSVKARGGFALAGDRPDGSIDVELDKLQVLDRPGQRVRLSGHTALQASGGQLGVDADLRVDEARIELAGGQAPQLADDVVVEGRTASSSQAPGAALHALVHLDLGRHFHVSGHGVDAELGGKLLVRSDPGRSLRAEGSIVVRSGTYGAYGQSLQLVPGGSVNFSGPVDNPGLNLAAQREGLPVQVGVSIAGTLQAPQVTLTSTPPMPDSAILSWLVLGQDPTTVASDQTSLLQAAGAALLSRGQSTSATGRVAGALGLDELKISGDGGLQNSVVTVGKKLSSRLSVSIERGLSEAGSLFNVRYAFTRRLSLRLQSGTDNAVDVFYTFRFD